MRAHIVGILLLSCAAATARAAESGVDNAKVYVSADGVELAVVTLKGQPKAVLKVTGSGTEVDGKARLHDVIEMSSRTEYRTKLHGGSYSTFLAGKNGQFELYLPKRGELRLKYSDEKTKALKADAILAENKKQTKDGSLAKLENFDRKATVADLEKELADESAAAEKSCGGKLPVVVDWAALSDDTLLKYSVGSFCGAPLGELRKLCESAEGKAWVNTKVKRIGCKFANSGSNATLEVQGDGTLKWSTAPQASNLEEVVHKQLVGEPAGDGEPPWGTLQSLAQRLALEKTTLCTDGKAHYVVVAPDENTSIRLYSGDGKSFVAVPSPGPALSGETFYDPRHIAPNANRDFRGVDMRVYSSVELDTEKKSCAVRCGDRTVPLKLVSAKETKPMLLAAKIGPTPQKWRPYALFRDEKGVYYFVDRGFKPGDEKRFRLFKGVTGALKEQKMTNVISDSEGEIFSTRSGSLKMIIDRKHPTVWVQAGKSTRLREVPVADNLPMIYSDLGVYSAERMGTPCDDL
jgi:hypothetical protein